jgi:hypothetical protein
MRTRRSPILTVLGKIIVAGDETRKSSADPDPIGVPSAIEKTIG